MAKAKKTILVGIPTFNGAHRVNNCLASIHKCHDVPDGYKVDYLIVDDGSTDPIKRQESIWVASHYNIPIIPHAENKGISKSWNEISRYGDFDIIILLNDDILVSHNWLTTFIYFLENNKNVGAIGWNQDFFVIEDVNDILSSLETDTPIRIYRDPHTKKVLAQNQDPETDEPGRMMVATGSAFGFTKEVFDLVDGFDERYKSFYEEMDFGTKLAKQGLPSYMLHYPRIYHMLSATFSENDAVLHGAKTMSDSRIEYRKKWGGDLDYTDEKFMSIIEPVEVTWLDEILSIKSKIIS